MNKFTNLPDSLMSLVGLVFWIGLFAGFVALLFATLSRIAGQPFAG